MSPWFDLMKLPHGGQIGSLKMSMGIGAAELPPITPSSRIRSATASGGGAADVVGRDAGDDDRHGCATTRATLTIAMTTVAATTTHIQGLRRRWGDGCPHAGTAALPGSLVFQVGGVGHPVWCGFGPPGPPGADVRHTGPGGGAYVASAGGTGVKPPGGPANAAGCPAAWLRCRISVARS